MRLTTPVSSSRVSKTTPLAVPGRWRMRTRPATLTQVLLGVWLICAAGVMRSFSRWGRMRGWGWWGGGVFWGGGGGGGVVGVGCWGGGVGGGGGGGGEGVWGGGRRRGWRMEDGGWRVEEREVFVFEFEGLPEGLAAGE